MKIEGLKSGWRRVEEAGIEVEAFVKDMHGMVKKYMRTEHQDKKTLLWCVEFGKGMFYV